MTLHKGKQKISQYGTSNEEVPGKKVPEEQDNTVKNERSPESSDNEVAKEDEELLRSDSEGDEPETSKELSARRQTVLKLMGVMGLLLNYQGSSAEMREILQPLLEAIEILVKKRCGRQREVFTDILIQILLRAIKVLLKDRNNSEEVSQLRELRRELLLLYGQRD